MLFQRFFKGFFALLLKCSCYLLQSSTRFCTSEAYVFWSFAKFQKAELDSSLHFADFIILCFMFRNIPQLLVRLVRSLFFQTWARSSLDTSEDSLKHCTGRCIAAGSTLKRCHGQGVIWEFGRLWWSLVSFPSYASCWVGKSRYEASWAFAPCVCSDMGLAGLWLNPAFDIFRSWFTISRQTMQYPLDPLVWFSNYECWKLSQHDCNHKEVHRNPKYTRIWALRISKKRLRTR